MGTLTGPEKLAMLDAGGYTLHVDRWYRDGECVGTLDEAVAHREAERATSDGVLGTVLVWCVLVAAAMVMLLVLGAMVGE